MTRKYRKHYNIISKIKYILIGAGLTLFSCYMWPEKVIFWG